MYRRGGLGTLIFVVLLICFRVGNQGRVLTRHMPGRQGVQAAPAFNERNAAAGNAEQGLTLLGEKKYDQAIECFDLAIGFLPGASDLYVNRGTAYAAKRDWESARADFNEAVKLDPHDPSALRGRAELLYRQHELDQALTDIDLAIQLDPKKPDGFILRGDIRLHQNHSELALSDYNEAIRLAPDKPEGYNARGFAREKAKAYREAVEDYARAIAVDASDFRGYNNLAWICATCPKKELRDARQAVEYAQYACQSTNFQDASSLDTLAAAYAEAGMFDDAVHWAKQALAETDHPLRDPEKVRSRLAEYKAEKPHREP